MRHRAALVIATLALSSRALSQVVPTAPAPDAVERLLASIRAGYDSGFSQLIAALPATARDRSTKLWLLWQLGQFRTQAVAWARLDGNRYLSVSQGPLMPAWLVVVPPGSEAFKRMPGTLQLDPTATILVAQMAPEPVTPTWAGVFLMRSEEHTSELQSRPHLVCRLLLEKKNSKFKSATGINTTPAGHRQRVSL